MGKEGAIYVSVSDLVSALHRISALLKEEVATNPDASYHAERTERAFGAVCH
jgi:hypothetical protein